MFCQIGYICSPESTRERICDQGRFLWCGVVLKIKDGELAHLVERLHGMQKVTGSTPVFSTLTGNIELMFPVFLFVYVISLFLQCKKAALKSYF